MKEIFHRVSIRKYENRPVEHEKLLAILRAGMQAPSATNQQPWEFFVVTDRSLLQALAETNPYAGCIAKAPVAMVLCSRKDCRLPQFADIDCAIAMENMWLAADALGLGGVWIGTAPLADRMKAVADLLQLPAHLQAFALFPLGYPAESHPQENRWDETRIHWMSRS